MECAFPLSQARPPPERPAFDPRLLSERLAPFPRNARTASGVSNSSTRCSARKSGWGFDASNCLQPPAPEAMTVPLPSWTSEKGSGDSVRNDSSSSESSDGSLSPMRPAPGRILSSGRLGSGESPVATQNGSFGKVAAPGTGNQALRRVPRLPRLAALLPPSISLTSAVAPARASRSLSPRGQRENAGFVTAYAAPATARLASPRRPGSLVSLAGSLGTSSLSGSFCHGSWCRGSFEQRVGSPRGAPSLSLGALGQKSPGNAFHLGSSSASLSSPLRYVARRSSSRIGSSSPRASSPVKVACQVLGTLVSRTRDVGIEEIDKENQCLTWREQQIKENALTRSKVLGSIDNSLQSIWNATLQSKTTATSLKPKAWAWDSTWAYDADFEEDEMHRQLWLRQPSAAAQFKRLSPGRYLYKNQKVELKIVYAQIFAVLADGQVIALEDFLSRHAEIPNSENAAVALASAPDASPPSSPSPSQSPRPSRRALTQTAQDLLQANGGRQLPSARQVATRKC